mmetsp:Transcript_22856/g.60216  ORF Transcript_22856/g.60216 Transcript_22856/m.60216 type:complete len:224 (+) Transcript_22856:862-1533(+)
MRSRRPRLFPFSLLLYCNPLLFTLPLEILSSFCQSSLRCFPCCLLGLLGSFAFCSVPRLLLFAYFCLLSLRLLSFPFLFFPVLCLLCLPGRVDCLGQFLRFLFFLASCLLLCLLFPSSFLQPGLLNPSSFLLPCLFGFSPRLFQCCSESRLFLLRFALALLGAQPPLEGFFITGAQMCNFCFRLKLRKPRTRDSETSLLNHSQHLAELGVIDRECSASVLLGF